MKIFLILLTTFTLGAKAQVDIEGKVTRDAIAVNALQQHVAHTVTNMKSAITYKTRTDVYGPSLYRVQLNYKLVWDSGRTMSMHLVVLATSG